MNISCFDFGKMYKFTFAMAKTHQLYKILLRFFRYINFFEILKICKELRFVVLDGT